MPKYLYEELTAEIIEACFEVSNELGAGFLESVYQHAVEIAFKQKGLKAQAQYEHTVMFRGEIVGKFYADFLVEDKVIVELKAVSALTTEHKAQVINYLKASNLQVGLLINFGTPRMLVHRLYPPQKPA